MIRRRAYLRDNPVHRLRDTIRSVARHILAQGTRIQLTARALRPMREVFSPLEDVIRNRDR